ncbi:MULTISPECIES: glycogen debranching N-terminal domain-containing protein [unclassified Knoellia]|uniref:amylo-alpha-1,6-glucosidase n=1 Tax=Knoellia altitudinis TaxID=3404795 RepID=UPI00360D0DC3
MTRYVQPWLHELEIAVRGNVTSVSDRHGDMSEPGTGLFVDDRRVLSLWEVRVADERPTWLTAGSSGPTTTVSTLLRSLGDVGADPTVGLVRERMLVDQGMRETLTVSSHAAGPVEVRLVIRLGADGADVATVKGGAGADVLDAQVSDGVVTWQDGRHATTFTASAGSSHHEDGSATWVWSTTVAPGGSSTLDTSVQSRRVGGAVFAADAGWDAISWDDVALEATDPRPGRVLTQSLVDLRGLLLTDPESPGDVFAAAGTPWYLTLFGRDSLWAARFMLPFGTDLARGTLRALARRQATGTDSVAASSPGKILHEVRRTPYVDPVTGMTLPPVYYGSVDATPLWVRLLHDSWRWGLDDQVVQELAPHLLAALSWMRAEAEQGDGLLRYVDESGSGLANQGWKDSGDSMRHRDGSIATGPIALLETQAYAVAAARGAAHLLESVLGEPGDEWRSWADELTDTVRELFWVDESSTGRYLSMAIAGDGIPVDGVGSNMGHVLGSGVLSAPEARRAARTLTAPDMLGDAGVRTLSRDNPAYNPVGYHTGSAWTHDNAIVALGLAREGFTEEAGRVLETLVEVASSSGNRWPELFGGELLMGRPVPYPASCRPQAWAAASAGVLVEVALGLTADAPNRSLTIAPMRPAPFGATRVRGIRVGDVEVSVSVDSGGEVVDVQAPGLEVTIA